MAFLEEVCHCRGGLYGLMCSSYTQCGTQSPLLSADQNVEHLATSPALSACKPPCPVMTIKD